MHVHTGRLGHRTIHSLDHFLEELGKVDGHSQEEAGG